MLALLNTSNRKCLVSDLIRLAKPFCRSGVDQDPKEPCKRYPLSSEHHINRAVIALVLGILGGKVRGPGLHVLFTRTAHRQGLLLTQFISISPFPKTALSQRGIVLYFIARYHSRASMPVGLRIAGVELGIFAQNCNIS